MNELRFDENLAIREVLDDIVAMVDRRERLIQSAAEQAEKSRDDRMARHVVKLESLMSDFLTLFDPILAKIRKYGEELRESIGESEGYLRSLIGIIDAGKGVQGTSATLQELEKDAGEVQEELEISGEVLGKIEDLFQKTKAYTPRQEVDQQIAGAVQSTNSIPESARREPRPSRLRVSNTYFLPGSRLLPNKPSKSQH